MRYNPHEWSELVRSVGQSGGALLPDACEPRPLTYKTPAGKKFHAETQGCGHERMVVLPYECSNEKQERREILERGGGFVRICAECDSLGMWPRFADVIAPEDD